jgi:signal transduction histidine kinase
MLKVKKQLSLKAQLALKHSLLFGLVITIVAIAAYAIMVRQMEEQLDAQLTQRAATVRSWLELHGDRASLRYQTVDHQTTDFINEAVRYYQVLDEQGHVLDTSHDARLLDIPFTEAARRALKLRRMQWETLALPRGDVRLLDMPAVTEEPGHMVVVRVGISLEDLQAAQTRLGAVMAGLIVLIIAVDAYRVWFIAGKVLGPVAQISTAAKKIMASDLDERLPATGTGDELDELRNTFNGMIARLHSSFKQMCDFLPRLSHELRKPLTILRTESELALRWANSEQDYREVLSNQLDQFELLSHVMSNLQTVLQAESGQLQVNKKTENLTELVRAAIDGMSGPAAERSIDISGRLTENITADIDTGQVWRLLLNLLDNAIKYNRTYGRVEVELTARGGDAVITITDTGIGIAPEELPRICEYFYRSADAKKHNIAGSGLGLSFARAIAQAHGGRIELTSTPGVGSRFQVWMPRVAAARPASAVVSISSSSVAAS